MSQVAVAAAGEPEKRPCWTPPPSSAQPSRLRLQQRAWPAAQAMRAAVRRSRSPEALERLIHGPAAAVDSARPARHRDRCLPEAVEAPARTSLADRRPVIR